MDILGKGIYSVSEASRLSGVSVQRIYSWFSRANRWGQPIINGDFVASEHVCLSFLDLIDTLIVGKLREKGVSLQHLRQVHSILIKELKTPHPFCRRELLTDGRKIFIGLSDGIDENLRELLTGQHAFPEILKPILHSVEYDLDSLLARRWQIGKGVIVDPKIQYGKPIIADEGIPTVVLASAYYANHENIKDVAEWYGVSRASVRTAVEFEQRINGVAA